MSCGVRRIFKKFLHIYVLKNGKSGRGGSIIQCQVNSQQGKPVDLAIGVRVTVKQ
jgi:hypothetical protein